MKERPILFKGRLVRRILAGGKTQTRRIMKPQPTRAHPRQESVGEVNGVPVSVTIGPGWKWRDLYAADDGGYFANALAAHCPYGQVGDRLWVKETLRLDDVLVGKDARDQMAYVADGAICPTPCSWKWQRQVLSSIHMPRWASRILLEVVGIRAEPLLDITEADAIAEGVTSALIPADEAGPVRVGYCAEDDGKCTLAVSPRDVFEELWKSTNGPESWDANPWVWVVEFKRIESAVEPIADLIARSSIGAGLADIKARGIDEHIVDLDLERETKPKRRRKR